MILVSQSGLSSIYTPGQILQTAPAPYVEEDGTSVSYKLSLQGDAAAWTSSTGPSIFDGIWGTQVTMIKDQNCSGGSNEMINAYRLNYEDGIYKGNIRNPLILPNGLGQCTAPLGYSISVTVRYEQLINGVWQSFR